MLSPLLTVVAGPENGFSANATANEYFYFWMAAYRHEFWRILLHFINKNDLFVEATVNK